MTACIRIRSAGASDGTGRSAERLAFVPSRDLPDSQPMDASEGPDTLPGVEVIDFYAERHLYTALGRRRITPPLRFGLAVLLHLRNRRAAGPWGCDQHG
jgi:hypothetical protein